MTPRRLGRFGQFVPHQKFETPHWRQAVCFRHEVTLLRISDSEQSFVTGSKTIICANSLLIVFERQQQQPVTVMNTLLGYASSDEEDVIQPEKPAKVGHC